ncbi:uncharacterized protein LOC121431137 isoform X1 [Lytechinus variegatus]|uniref:uncharacterized protein LOC121431137 isoform X1 n=1 Tax=Lytechinus variegatus TaxID=7654 RepID=UPI001BB10D7D|nr:uncharacterized protein LOC121431137 isoform X1 [Lytechinus variegatus]
MEGHYFVSLLIMLEILSTAVDAFCDAPSPVAATHHNGTLAVYKTGDTLYFTCDTGYSTNYDPPSSTCLANGIWNPSDLACELNTLSLIISIIVAVITLFVFVVIVICIFRRKRRQTHASSPKIIRRSPKFPEYPPENFEMSRPGSLYDSIKINVDKNAINGAIAGMDGISEQSDGLDNPIHTDNGGIDIIDADGLNMTRARVADRSRSRDYEYTNHTQSEVQST